MVPQGVLQPGALGLAGPHPRDGRRQRHDDEHDRDRDGHGQPRGPSLPEPELPAAHQHHGAEEQGEGRRGQEGRPLPAALHRGPVDVRAGQAAKLGARARARSPVSPVRASALPSRLVTWLPEDFVHPLRAELPTG